MNFNFQFPNYFRRIFSFSSIRFGVLCLFFVNCLMLTAYAQKHGRRQGKSSHDTKGDGIGGVNDHGPAKRRRFKSVKSDSKGKFVLEDLKCRHYTILFSRKTVTARASYTMSKSKKRNQRFGRTADFDALTRERRLLSKAVFSTETAEASTARKSRLKNFRDGSN